MHDAGGDTIAHSVLWDVDGTLVDSADVHYHAWNRALGIVDRRVTRDEFTALFGLRTDDTIRRVMGSDVSRELIETIATAKDRHYRTLMRDVRPAPMPGIRELLTALASANWSQAVASSLDRSSLDLVLAATGLSEHLAISVSADDVERGKPDPESFLLAAHRLQVPGQCCAVIEDPQAGLGAAGRAGMRSIGLLTTHATLDADHVVPDATPPLRRHPRATRSAVVSPRPRPDGRPARIPRRPTARQAVSERQPQSAEQHQ